MTTVSVCLVLFGIIGAALLISCNPDDPAPSGYETNAAATARELDEIEVAVRRIVDEAASNPNVTQQPDWQQRFRVEVARVREIETAWQNRSPPTEKATYHNEMKAYIDITLRQYELMLEGLVEKDGTKVAQSLALRDEGRAKLNDIRGAVGVVTPTDTELTRYRDAGRKITRQVTDAEAELLRLTNSAIADEALTRSTAWRTDMAAHLSTLSRLKDEWIGLKPPSEWRPYHQAHLDYIGLDIEGYRLVLEGVTEGNERKLQQAEVVFRDLLAKREELLRLVPGSR